MSFRFPDSRLSFVIGEVLTAVSGPVAACMLSTVDFYGKFNNTDSGAVGATSKRSLPSLRGLFQNFQALVCRSFPLLEGDDSRLGFRNSIADSLSKLNEDWT